MGEPVKVTPTASPPDGNGYHVRPDFQTKLIGLMIAFVFLGAIGWVGNKVSDLSDRTTRLETLVDVKLDEVLRRLEKLENGKDNK